MVVLSLQAVIPAKFISIRKMRATIASAATIVVHSKTNQLAWRSQIAARKIVRFHQC
jgi:hypothetical protein